MSLPQENYTGTPESKEWELQSHHVPRTEQHQDTGKAFLWTTLGIALQVQVLGLCDLTKSPRCSVERKSRLFNNIQCIAPLINAHSRGRTNAPFGRACVHRLLPRKMSAGTCPKQKPVVTSGGGGAAS